MLKAMSSVYIAPCEYDATVFFYKDIVGMDIEETFQGEDGHRGCLMKLGDFTLTIAEPHADAPDRSAWQTRLTNQKVVLGFTVDDVDKTYKEVLAQGVTPIVPLEDSHFGTRRFVVADPDGIRIELYQEKE